MIQKTYDVYQKYLKNLEKVDPDRPIIIRISLCTTIYVIGIVVVLCIIRRVNIYSYYMITKLKDYVPVLLVGVLT